MRRALIAGTGLLLAFLVGMGVLAVLLVSEAMTLPRATSLDLVHWAAWVGAAVAQGGGTVLWVAVVALCFAPVTLVGLLGEAARLRGPIWYVGATGALTAAVPTIARVVLGTLPEGGAGTAEGRVTLLLFLTGVAAGFVYWLIAGRTAALS